MTRPLAFISYAYDSAEHRSWVLKLANDLIGNGIKVLLDQYELTAGRELTQFMESSLEQASKVLLILTPGYKARAGERRGGAGFEYSMISKELMAIQVGSDKFIPVLRAGTAEESAPIYMQGRLYHDMRNDGHYGTDLFKLVRLLYDEPEIKKPELGPVPDFNSPFVDPLLTQLQRMGEVKNEAERLAAIVDSGPGVNLAVVESRKVFSLLKEKAKLYNEASVFRFTVETDDHSRFRIVAGRHTVMLFWRQAYSNTSRESTLRVLYWAGIEYFNGPDHRARLLQEHTYAFDLGQGEVPQWKFARLCHTTQELVQDIFVFLIDHINAAEQSNR